MFKWLILIALFCNQILLAQDLSEDLRFIETQNTHSNPLNVPIYVDLAGNLSLITRGDLNPAFNAAIHVGYKTSTSVYNLPVQSSAFALTQPKTETAWVEVKRKRWELGLGLAARIANQVVSVGLAPYKGARQVMIRHKENRDDVTPDPSLPQSLQETLGWSEGDNGSFQRYGGLQLWVGAGMSGLRVTTGLTIQNLWSVGLKKISQDKVQLTLSEESLKKRRIQAGAAVSNIKLHWFNGKQLSMHFTLNLNDPSHEELYKMALKGRIDQLQTAIPQEAQKMSWDGTEKLGYIGIPGVMGKHFQRAEYVMDFEDEFVEDKDTLDIKTRRSSGAFLRLRNHNQLVYQTDTAIVLFWYSEMTKAKGEVLSRRFLTPGRILGAKGFDVELSPEVKMGSALAQMGMSFTREELEAVTPEMLETILQNFKERCEELDLSCAQPKRYNKIGKTLRSYMNLSWEDVRDKLGFLMIEEPALINAYLKSIRAKKKLYFKFLNESFQSVEGVTDIVI